MKTVNRAIVALTILSTLLPISCNGEETSGSLQDKYGLAPLGIETCDDYLNKLRMCLDKAPSKNHSSIVKMYTFIISDMKILAEDNSPESQQAVISACSMGEAANSQPMKEMGCDW